MFPPPPLRPGRVSPGFLLRPVVSGTHGTGSLWLDHRRSKIASVRAKIRLLRAPAVGRCHQPIGDNDFS